MILDANAVGLRPLAGNPQQVLLDAARRGQVTLVVAELTIREVVMSGRRRRARRWSGCAWPPTIAVAHGLGISVDVAEVDLAARAAEVERRLRDRWPTRVPWLRSSLVKHEELAARALRREQPFDNQGHNGYRDALLWHARARVCVYGCRRGRSTLWGHRRSSP